MLYHLEFNQNLPISLKDAWNFFSKAENLLKITPDILNFKITYGGSESIYPGQIIAYRVRPIWNLSFEWITEITHVAEPHYFIDEQRLGPYKFWHHKHVFQEIPHGIRMIDSIVYLMPYGILGKVLNDLKVRKDLEKIFFYRKQKLVELFGSYKDPD